jgi:hypothetical protein
VAEDQCGIYVIREFVMVEEGAEALCEMKVLEDQECRWGEVPSSNLAC